MKVATPSPQTGGTSVPDPLQQLGMAPAALSSSQHDFQTLFHSRWGSVPDPLQQLGAARHGPGVHGRTLFLPPLPLPLLLVRRGCCRAYDEPPWHQLVAVDRRELDGARGPLLPMAMTS